MRKNSKFYNRMIQSLYLFTKAPRRLKKNLKRLLTFIYLISITNLMRVQEELLTGIS
jgi:hypothetical protein